MNPRTAPWVVAAVVQAVAIVVLSLQLASDPVAAGPLAADAALPVSPTGAQPGAASAPHAREAPADVSSTAAAARRVDELPAPAAAQPSLGTLVHGDVRARDGAHVEQASVAVYLGEETKALGQASLYRRGDEPGAAEFAIPGFAPGDYRLTARSQNMRQFTHAFTVPPGAPDLRVDVMLEPSWMIKVLLLAPDGRPLHDALAGDKDLQAASPFGGPVHVIAWHRELPAQLPPTDGRETTFTIATFHSSSMQRGEPNQLPARYAGMLEMREDRPAVVAAVVRNAVLAQVPVQPGDAEATLTIDPQRLRAMLATVRLQVVDAATSQPVPTAKVGLNDTQGFRQPTAVDAEGRCELTKLRPGRYQLTVEAGAEWVAPLVSVDVAAGGITDLGAVRLVAPFELRVKVTGLATSQGNERRAAGGTLTPLEIVGVANAVPRSLRLSLNKDELKRSVAPGRYLLRITDGTNGAFVELDTRRLGSEPLVVNAQPEPVLRVDPSQLDEPLRLVLRATSGAVVHDRWITWKTAFNVQLPAGEYRVALHRLEGAAREDVLTLAPGGGQYPLR